MTLKSSLATALPNRFAQTRAVLAAFAILVGIGYVWYFVEPFGAAINHSNSRITGFGQTVYSPAFLPSSLIGAVCVISAVWLVFNVLSLAHQPIFTIAGVRRETRDAVRETIHQYGGRFFVYGVCTLGVVWAVVLLILITH